MKLFSIHRVILVGLTMILFSCQKESSENNSSNPVTEEETAVLADETVQAEASFDDIEDIGMTAAEEESNSSPTTGRSIFEELRLRLGICAEITVTPADGSFPKTITIDFGDGCLCADGKFRKGAIILHLTAPIRRHGAVLTISLRNFYLNRAHIEGTKTITNLSVNSEVKFTVQVNDGKVTLPNGRGYIHNSLKYVKQVHGAGTLIVRDDVYTIEGRSQTAFNNGVTITLNTETPLVKKVICPWISEGQLKIKINDRILFLHYAAPAGGECDNKALLTWNNGNNQRLITLP